MARLDPAQFGTIIGTQNIQEHGNETTDICTVHVTLKTTHDYLCKSNPIKEHLRPNHGHPGFVGNM